MLSYIHINTGCRPTPHTQRVYHQTYLFTHYTYVIWHIFWCWLYIASYAYFETVYNISLYICINIYYINIYIYTQAADRHRMPDDLDTAAQDGGTSCVCIYTCIYLHPNPYTQHCTPNDMDAPWKYTFLLQNIVSFIGVFCKRDL